MNNRRSYSNDRHKEYHQSRNRENGRRDSLHDHTEHSSSHRPDRKEYSSKRRSSRERSYSEERKRRHSEHDRLSRDGQSYRERSRERRERQRSVEKKERDRPRERRMSTLPHYIEPVPVPVYYGNYPPRPVMIGPMMLIRGPLMRNMVFPIFRSERTLSSMGCSTCIHMSRMTRNIKWRKSG